MKDTNPAHSRKHRCKRVVLILCSVAAGGKGTQRKRLILRYKKTPESTFDTGAQIGAESARSTEFRKLVHTYQFKGEMVPTSLVMPLYHKWQSELAEDERFVILDGIPRVPDQLEVFDDEDCMYVIVHILLPDIVADARMIERAKDDPARENEKKPEVRASRILQYRNVQIPLLKHIEENGLATVHEIVTDGLQEPDVVTDQIVGILNYYGVHVPADDVDTIAGNQTIEKVESEIVVGCK